MCGIGGEFKNPQPLSVTRHCGPPPQFIPLGNALSTIGFLRQAVASPERGTRFEEQGSQSEPEAAHRIADRSIGAGSAAGFCPGERSANVAPFLYRLFGKTPSSPTWLATPQGDKG
jgi:hypothetical protein